MLCHGLMASTIMYLVENVDDCAHTKREVAPTNVSECVCANECARVLTYLSFITVERSPLARGRQPDNTTVVVFSNNKGRSGHNYENERVDNLPTYLV